MKIYPQHRKNILNAFIFILGVIVTIAITKASNKVAPDEPVIVKQISDTIKIVHEYNLPKEIEDDTIRKDLENKIKNLELLNNYDKQIKERLTKIQSTSSITPNLIITQNLNYLARKGYAYGNTSPYFSSDCPNLNGKIIDLKFDFLNSEVLKDIACLRLNIYKFDNYNEKEARTYVLESFYEIKNSGNFIRINNDLTKGKYEFMYGFMFKNDLKKEYPTFYFKKCIINKE
jgi:hypothetical protein